MGRSHRSPGPLHEPARRLSPAAAGHLEKGGWYVTSGILDIKEEIVSKAIREAGFAIEEVLRDGEWCAVISRKM